MEGEGGFWSHSPGQIVAVLKSQGLIRKKGTAADIKRMFGGQRGVRTRLLPTRVDNPDDAA